MTQMTHIRNFIKQGVLHSLISSLLAAASGPILFILFNIGMWSLGECFLIFLIGSIISFGVAWVHTLLFTLPISGLFREHLAQQSVMGMFVGLLPIQIGSIILSMYFMRGGWFDNWEVTSFSLAVMGNAASVLFIFCRQVKKDVMKHQISPKAIAR
ncbi:MAG: hypothetical protein AAF206_12085 [Bacteroidota bacterium]